MRIPLDHQSKIPLYKQIEHYLRQQILSGQLAPATRLPASRQLAQELGVSRITVNNAYAQLESEGLLYGRAGSGVYVFSLAPLPPSVSNISDASWPLWQQLLEREDEPPYETRAMPARRVVKHPRPIAFTGVGDPREFPIKEFTRAIQEVIRRDGAAALEYGGLDQGYPPLRTTLTHVLGSQGIQAHPDNILITSGSQQALALICQVLLKPGDVVLVESPTYNLALELLQALDLQIVGAPVDEQGMCVEQLEPLLQQHHPRLIYTIPNFQNPTGSCLSGGRRRQLVALADRYNIPVVEDDFVGDLRYEGRIQPALKTLDPRGRVIYVGTFSKMLMPGLRVGFLVAEGPVLRRLIDMKRVSDLTTPTLMQRALEAYVNVGRYQAHVRRSCRLYRQRRDAMLAAIKRHLPAEVQVTPPHGGLFIWLRLPDGFSCLDLLPVAAEAGVEYAPGARFFPNPADGEPYLRLNFATQTPAEIEEGIQRLASALRRLSRPTTTSLSHAA
jgi:GntR family transcriptional regulator/MocR family aminotransferase